MSVLNKKSARNTRIYFYFGLITIAVGLVVLFYNRYRVATTPCTTGCANIYSFNRTFEGTGIGLFFVGIFIAALNLFGLVVSRRRIKRKS